MTRVITAACIVAGAIAVVPLPAAAQKMTSCQVGQRVKTPGGDAGTIVAVPKGACVHKSDRWGTDSTWAPFMLTPIGTPPAATMVQPGRQPNPGNYQCYGGGAAGNMKLRFTGGSGYANEQGQAGNFKFRPSGQMEFVSGPWKGFYAKTMDNGRVGLTSKPDGTFYNMTCDPK